MTNNDTGDLILHCAILWDPDHKSEQNTKDYLALIKHILTIAPETLEKKSAEGYTPLQLAVFNERKDVVAYLLSIGANQRTRDRNGRNLLHSLAPRSRLATGQLAEINETIELFDKTAVKEMMLERTSVSYGSLTPLAYWMGKTCYFHTKPDLMNILTQYSSGEDLGMIDGQGDLPLHIVSPLYLLKELF